MDPSRATKFIESLDRSPKFRKKFGGLYIPMITALERLGGSAQGTPAFIEDKVTMVRTALEEEERPLAIIRAEVSEHKGDSRRSSPLGSKERGQTGLGAGHWIRNLASTPAS